MAVTMSAPLPLTYESQHLLIADTSKALIRRKPHILAYKSLVVPDIGKQNAMSVGGFWSWFQSSIEVYLNIEVRLSQIWANQLEWESRI